MSCTAQLPAEASTTQQSDRRARVDTVGLTLSLLSYDKFEQSMGSEGACLPAAGPCPTLPPPPYPYKQSDLRLSSIHPSSSRLMC